jgi:uncharacterized membrane-anchored protein YjiN (DUF445 family)
MTQLTQDRSLARMKGIALGLLALAAVLYALARWLEPRHPGWGYLAAFAEAAMVGAMADWFAVVALFRRPLGLPIPHTAIIPANKARIGRNLADFICSHFLGTAQVLDKLRQFDAAGRLATWLAQPAHAEQVGRHLASTARYGLQALDDERVRQFLRHAVLSRLEQVDVARLGGRILELLTADRRHQALLDEVLGQLAGLLDDEAIRELVAEGVAAEVRLLRYVGMDIVAAKLLTRKIVAGVGRLIAEMGDDPQHPLRLRFDDFMAGFVQRLQDDPALRLKGEAIRQELLAHPALADYLHGLWSELLAWLHDDLARDDSSIRSRIAGLALTLGDKLQADAPMQQWINAQLLAAAPQWIDRYREDIRRYIVDRVDAWDTAEMTVELERNIGTDLQFVRINGTLVGGLVGLLIHALTQALRG